MLVFALMPAGCSDSTEHERDETPIVNSRQSDVTENAPDIVDKPKDAAIETLEAFHRDITDHRLRQAYNTWGDYNSYTYECSADTGKVLKDEYVSLLVEEYPFQVAGSYKIGRTFETVLLRYTGSKNVSTFADADYKTGKIYKCNLLVAIDNDYDRDRVQIFINLAPELKYGDSR